MAVKQNPSDQDFPHGTSKGYHYGCKVSWPCPSTPTCTQARNERDKCRLANVRAGKRPSNSRVSAEPARAHIEGLVGQGCTTLQMAIAAGLGSVVNAIFRGSRSGCTKETLDLILGLTVEDCMTAERMMTRHFDGHRVAADPVRKHIKALLAVPNVSCTTIAFCADLADSTVRSVLFDGRATLRAVTAKKIMALTKKQVAEARTTTKVTPKHIQLIRSMQVQGWSMEWQAEQVGRSIDCVRMIAYGQVDSISGVLHAAIHDLASMIERWGRIKERGNWGPSYVSAGKARAKGWQPLACYDDDGTLLDTAPRDEALEDEQRERHMRAYNRLEALRLSLRFGLNTHEIGDRLKVDPTQVQRWRAQTGLRFDKYSGFVPGIPAHRYVLRPGYEERAALVLAVVSKFEADPLIDPVPLSKELTTLINEAKEPAKKKVKEAAAVMAEAA